MNGVLFDSDDRQWVTDIYVLFDVYVQNKDWKILVIFIQFNYL